jgi:hypothetical protein
MGFVPNVFMWGEDGSYDKKYKVSVGNITGLPGRNYTIKSFGRNDWLYTVAIVFLWREAVQWFKARQRRGRNQRQHHGGQQGTRAIENAGWHLPEAQFPMVSGG